MTTLENIKKVPTSPLKGISKSFSNSSSELQSFEEIYKTSYSHGLEAIYALENVDIKSVRRIETTPKPICKRSEIKKGLPHPIQEEFDLGDEYRGWIPSLVKKEPIHVLELSRYTEKCLIENGKSKLGDLIGVNLKDFVFLRGMGQGHIEEIQKKLNTYLEGHDLDKCYKVDFSSWLKCLVAAHDRKKVFALLETFDLADHFSLTPGESVEVRKLTLEKKQEWIEELLSKVAQPLQKRTAQEDMLQIFNVFIKPWIRKRGGFAKQDELNERLQRISVNSVVSSNILTFLRTVFFDDKDLFKLFLQEVDQHVYCSDAFYAFNYEKIVKKSLSYFYKPSIYYQLNELICLLEREFSISWIGYPEGYIEKVLRLSPSFCISKNIKGFLEIKHR